MPALMRALACAALVASVGSVAEVHAQPDPRSIVYLEADRTRGAGVVLSSDGLILTSTRAVSKSGTVEVTLHPSLAGGGGTLKASVVARDDWFTLLLVDGQGFVPARMGSTQSLKLNDRALTLGTGDADFGLEQTSLGAVAPLKNKGLQMEEPLLTATEYKWFNAGGPVFTLDGKLIGIIQSQVGNTYKGSKALRVEDIRAFLGRAKERLPARQMTLVGPVGTTVETEHIPAAELPLTFTFRPGDIFTFRVSRQGQRCGVYRPDTRTYEPRTTVALDATGDMGTLVLETSPKDARVQIDGADVGQGGGTFACMSQGTHTVIVTAPLHEGQKVMATVVSGQETRMRVPLRKMRGTFSVATAPAGGEVWVDGQKVGDAPVSKVAMPVGPHVVSVVFPGGARLRRAWVAEDGKHAELGTVTLPPPGAVLHLEHSNVDTVLVDGHDVGPVDGHVVLKPGAHVIQARDPLGNVLTETWDAPMGGVKLLRFQGGSSKLIPTLHVVGAAFVAGAALLLLVGTAVLVGLPVGLLLGGWAAGAALDVVHRQLWVPALALGFVGGLPALALGMVALVPGIMVPPWELLFRDGSVVARGEAPQPLAYAVPEGWELRPVASAWREAVPTTAPSSNDDTPLVPHVPGTLGDP